MKNIVPFAAIAVLAAASVHAESRALGAHEHGHGALNIAFEGDTVLLELEAPGADIVGFEHAAVSAKDRAAVDNAVAMLAKPLELFIPDDAAGCVVASASVKLVAEGDGRDQAGHDDHGRDEHGYGEHGHDEGHAGHGHDSPKHDDHGHEQHAAEGGEGHTEFHAAYTLTCADPAAIRSLDFAYFERFPNAEELDVQFITDKGARGFAVGRDDPRLDLAGAI